MKTATPERKSSKTLKGQLFGAVSMMLVAAIALGTSTYAWFINNQTVEIQKMNLTVSTATSLQIAVHRNTTTATDKTPTLTPYKNLIATADITTDNTTSGAWTNMFGTSADYLLQPASADNINVTAGKFFASNGHMNTAGDKLDQFVSATVGEGNVKKLPLSFLSSSDLNVYFGQKDLETIANLITAHTGATSVNGSDADAQAAAIRTALRVAIVPKTGTATPGDYSSGTTTIFQFNDGSSNAITAQTDNTAYGTATMTGLTHDESAGKYIAITGIDTDNTVTAAGQQTAQVPGADITTGANLYIVTVSVDGNGVTTVTNYKDNVSLFDLKANKARDVDVYIWLEGTDGDCLSVLSQFTFDIALPFAGAPTTTTDRPTP